VNPEGHENDSEGLAESVRANQTRARIRRTRKNSLRAKPGSDARRAVANERKISPLARLMGAFRAEKIEFLKIGMTKNWLPDMDLNHDKQIQSLLCYRYTIGQKRGLKCSHFFGGVKICRKNTGSF
jgi:hypothetical protein